ncbi:C4-dicarboxylate TRAP transporter substrate-binding protein [Treponema phagedenis]|uniref:C4-dicarboxylate TRAP transporter substrate-binding protein n=1 Tax=Treponema phagedenis TaxID=162 RepID=UPI0001F64107|nr:C4-dicarboxylate TRAP transporter substrate-binding protein [Treponema phagedenis]EFW37811.1 bacterial extracellular solute-binding protein, family 7 [Treponema phagedenis F0421]
MKKIVFYAMMLIVAVAISITACTKNDGATTGTKKVIRVTTKFVDNEQTAKSLVKVVEGVNSRSNGTLELQLFTSGTYPYGKDGMELIVNGGDVIQVDGINFIADYVPDFDAVTGPFLYTSFDEYLAMTKSDLVAALKQEAVEKHGIRILSLDWVFGFRSMMLKKPVKTPDDMRGLKIRVPTSPLYTYTLEAMGANPIAMPYPDTYSAIQQGVIDGVEGSILTYWGTKQYENVKEYSLTRHLLGVSAVTISEKCWQSLTAEQQQILTEEFQKGTDDNLKETIALEDDYAEKLKEQGVHFYEIDAPAFAAKAAVVYTKFPKWTAGIYDQIQAELKKIRATLKK